MLIFAYIHKDVKIYYMSNQIGNTEPLTPRLNPADVRVFLAEDDQQKRDEIVASLGDFGLNHSITVATSLEEANVFIAGQRPHELMANVFLLDGGLNSNDPESLWHGSHLGAKLLSSYAQPMESVTDTAAGRLKELGLTRNQVDSVIDSRMVAAIRNIARQQLQSEALLVGISRVPEGGLSHVAQLPWIEYRDVGKLVFDSVVPRSFRSKMETQQLREEQRARFLAAQTPS